MKRILPLVLALSLTLCACGQPAANDTSSSVSTSDTSSVSANTAQNDSEMFTDRDYRVEYDEAQSVHISLNGDSVSCDSDAVVIDGTTVTITDEGTFILSGTLNDGMIIVNCDEKDKPQIVLNGVSINSATSAALYILEADKVFVTLAENTENTLANGGTFTAIDENNIDAAVFSKQDLTFNGSGTLTVTSPVGHGIVSKDDLVLTSGTYTVNSSSHGLDANDSVRVTNVDMTVSAGKDGIHAENSDDTEKGFVYISSGNFTISAEGDGISAGAYMNIESGVFDILTGGGSVNASKQTSDSWGGFMGGMGGGRGPGGGDHGGGAGMMRPGETAETTDESSTGIKGLKATSDLIINGGTFTIDSADDAVHSNLNLTVNGGVFEVSSGDDGFHADETLTITAGTINITESYEGLEGLHVKVLGGDISLVSSDDGLNAAGGTDESGFGGNRGGDMFGGMGMGGMMSAGNGSIVISGGKLYVNASGDGIDANGTLEITGGYTVVCGPTQGDTATLDYDKSAVISGGTFIGTGASGMAQTFSDATQGLLSLNVGNQSAGTLITLSDKDGNVIIAHTPRLNYAVVILSSPDIVSGETYTVTVGSNSQEFTAK